MSSHNIELQEDFDKGFYPENLFDSIDHNIIKEILICPIIPHILEDPMKCNVCEAHFCRKCLEKALELNNKCPLCRTEIELDVKGNSPSKIIISMLDNLKVSCENKSKGCNEKFYYKNKESFNLHLSESCDYVDVLCPLYKCSKPCMKKNLESHIDQCSLEELECEYCNTKIKRISMEDHILSNRCSSLCRWCSKRYSLSKEPNHQDECDLLWIVCLYCQKTLYKKDFLTHKENECSYKNILYLAPSTVVPKETAPLYIRNAVSDDRTGRSSHARVNMYKSMNPPCTPLRNAVKYMMNTNTTPNVYSYHIKY